MKQRYRELDTDLCWQAIDKCYRGKWGRNDVLTDIEEWTGYSRNQIREYKVDHPGHEYPIKHEIMEERAEALYDMITGILHGEDPDFDLVSIRRRADGATGKMRNIAYLCIRMQLLGHCLQLGLEPLLKSRILPCQHASLPGGGPTRLVRQLRRQMRKKNAVRYFAKTDCKNAYGSTMYRDVIALIREEIPDAKWILAGLETIAEYAPGGHLIIGGYLDAWLFNFVMSYGLREALKAAGGRRGHRIRMVSGCEDYMDDVVYLGTSRKGLKAGSKACMDCLRERFGIESKQTTGYIRLLSREEERQRKARASPAARGCPAIDVAGYRISRTHCTMRRRNARRTRRCFLRAWTEKERTGTLKRQRAAQIISRNGIAAGADNCRFLEKYHVVELRRMARRIIGHWGRIETRERKEILEDAVEKYRKHREALESHDWDTAGRREARSAG